MSNEVTVHNIADTIRAKVKDYIIDSIPKEQFDGLIKKQWDDFFVDRSDNWNKRPSEFSVLVQAAIKKELEIKIDESIKKELESIKITWENTGHKVIAQAVQQYAPHFIAGLSEAAVNVILQAERQRRGVY